MAKAAPKEPKKIGRPLTYDNNHHPQAVLTYLESCKDKLVKRLSSYTNTDGDKGTSESRSYELKQRVNLPTMEGLARYLNVNRDTILDWKGKYKDFSVALEKLMEEQASRLLNSGLSGHYNSTIAKLILANNHGYRDKTDNTHQVNVVNMAMDWGDE